MRMDERLGISLPHLAAVISATMMFLRSFKVPNFPAWPSKGSYWSQLWLVNRRLFPVYPYGGAPQWWVWRLQLRPRTIYRPPGLYDAPGGFLPIQRPIICLMRKLQRDTSNVKRRAAVSSLPNLHPFCNQCPLSCNWLHRTPTMAHQRVRRERNDRVIIIFGRCSSRIFLRLFNPRCDL